MAAEILVACGQITWRGSDMPEEQRLAEIAQAGYDGTSTSLRDRRSAEKTLAVLARHGLKPAPGSIRTPFWDRGEWDQILEQARLTARYMREVGLTEVYLMPAPLTRRELSGHVGPGDGLSDEEFKQGAELLNDVGRITLEEGVRSCFHNHVGCLVETQEEIDRLFSAVDRDLVFQGPDLGHLAWAGGDVLQFCRDYADSIKTLHIKDINPEVLRTGVEQEWDYDTFSDNGIFTELGEGFIDYAAVFDILKEAGFEGWAVVETDVTQKATALESAIVSRSYLRSIGI